MKDTKGVGVIIGRFQPFHLGHAWLIKKSLDKFDKIIILIGSSNIHDKDNLWSFDVRKKMLEIFIEKNDFKNRILKVEDIIDVPDDDKWFGIAFKKIGRKDFVVVGDNEWVNRIFENAGCKVWRTGYFERDRYEGARIRKLYKTHKNWADRVPKYVVELIRT